MRWIRNSIKDFSLSHLSRKCVVIRLICQFAVKTSTLTAKRFFFGQLRAELLRLYPEKKTSPCSRYYTTTDFNCRNFDAGMNNSRIQ